MPWPEIRRLNNQRGGKMKNEKSGKTLFIGATICVVIASLVLAFISNEKQIRVYNIIQAAAIILLVFVTMFYAIQTKTQAYLTKQIIEEEQKKRLADFGERRIKETLRPLGEYLMMIDVLLGEQKVDFKSLNEEINKFIMLHFKNGYMLTKQLNKDILKFRSQINSDVSDLRKRIEYNDIKQAANELRKEMKSRVNEMIEKLRKETRDISIKIKKTYGYYTDEKIDDLDRKKSD